jgi:hypothetical protein
VQHGQEVITGEEPNTGQAPAQSPFVPQPQRRR